MSSLYITGLP
ncbi:hypothetical protein Zm00014a_043049 [Zea mays]|uniref:Uncharacterized protein n=1 Tax=Zea mays TaxID=4577 RepID=A0A3L6DM27_MAIZE|nr:hypothetical protein Zm00014a_043049 [Zea mays]